MSARADHRRHYEFELDRFQIEAIEAIDAKDHVVVAAPTGSGKTVVAEHALRCSGASGRRAFYTTPIKALSNQKYRDLVEMFGADEVGLLTGDNAVNGDAPIVVMTTEVLRNMIYAGRALDDLAAVVIDEVHFLQDAYRGPVWEEVIIHLPEHVQLVCLSATVSNSDELSDWIETVRGPTTAVVEQRRPVELENLFLVDDRTHHTLRIYRTLIDGDANKEMLKLDMNAVRGRRRRQRSSGQRQLATPDRIGVIDRLRREGLLPAIFFIFSRNQCSETASAAYASGLRLTSDEEREAIGRIARDRLAFLSDDDLAVLGYEAFLEQLEAGIAAHHAGMVPPFKEVVEQCFIAGLVKVVFATETLAVGVNMPARSVVIDKLTKFTGERHESLTPAEYSQLTGRAGRRGIDEKGSAIVLWSPYVRFDDVAALARSRSFHLRSAFRPTYNMATNLVGTYDQTNARQLLTQSFAQFQADRDVVKLERRLAKKRRQLARLHEKAASPYGDIFEYRRDGPRRRPDDIDAALAALQPGEVIDASSAGRDGPVAVVATAMRKDGLKVTTITPDGTILKLRGRDFDAEPTTLGHIVLPGAFSPNQRSYRTEVAGRIDRLDLDGGATRGRPRSAADVEADPELASRLAVLDDADRLATRITELERRVDKRNASLARDFDAVLGVLDERGYLDVEAWSVLEPGRMLARTFHECDLLICEVVRRGVLDVPNPATLAALVSSFVYSHRSPDDPPPPWFPDGDARQRWLSIAELSEELRQVERRHQVPEHRPPDPTFAALAYAWVAGEGFAEIVGEEELTGGDFVRTMKQLIDLLGQLAAIVDNPKLSSTAHQAAETARRGIVADASLLT